MAEAARPADAAVVVYSNENSDRKRPRFTKEGEGGRVAEVAGDVLRCLLLPSHVETSLRQFIKDSLVDKGVSIISKAQMGTEFDLEGAIQDTVDYIEADIVNWLKVNYDSGLRNRDTILANMSKWYVSEVKKKVMATRKIWIAGDEAQEVLKQWCKVVDESQVDPSGKGVIKGEMTRMLKGYPDNEEIVSRREFIAICGSHVQYTVNVFLLDGYDSHCEIPDWEENGTSSALTLKAVRDKYNKQVARLWDGLIRAVYIMAEADAEKLINEETAFIHPDLFKATRKAITKKYRTAVAADMKTHLDTPIDKKAHNKLLRVLLPVLGRKYGDRVLAQLRQKCVGSL